MTYKIQIDKSVKKFLLKHQDVAHRFFEKIKELAQDPYTKKLDIKRLQWSEKWNYRIRIWKYRFKYTIIEDQILIYFYDADSRGDVYK